MRRETTSNKLSTFFDKNHSATLRIMDGFLHANNNNRYFLQFLLVRESKKDRAIQIERERKKICYFIITVTNK